MGRGGYGGARSHIIFEGALSVSKTVSSIYIWSEIFRSPSETKYGGHGGSELLRFQSPYAVFHVYVLRKNRAGGTETDITQGLHVRHTWLFAQSSQ